MVSLQRGVVLPFFFRNTTGTIRFECRPYGQGNVEQPVAMAVHEHAPKVGACYDSANRDAHPVIVMLENEMCDRLPVRAAILTAATEAPRASIQMILVAEAASKRHCLVVPVRYHVLAAFCEVGSSSPSSQSSGTLLGKS